MYYDYGPLRFSVWRGILLTLAVPVFIAVALATFEGVSSSTPFSDALKTAFGDIRDLYRQFKIPALIMHAAFFVKGLVFRRRYVTYAPQFATLALVLAFALAAATKLGMDPQELLSDVVSTPSLSPTSSVDLSTTTNHAPSSTSPPSGLAVSQSHPNQLQQRKARTPAILNVSPDNDGQFLAPGHMGRSAVVYVLNQRSPYSAAPSSLASAVSGPCKPSSFLMDGTTISGCLGWVDDLDIGPLELPRTLFFFSSSLPAGRVHLGSNAIAHLASASLPTGAIQLTLRPK